MNKKYSVFQDYLILTLGIVVNSFGWAAFLIPSKIVGGGLTGVGTIIYYFTKFPVGISYAIMNIFLLLIAFKIMGVSFGARTIYGIFGASTALSIFQPLFQTPLVTDTFMATIIGGALLGVGRGILFSKGGSSGGTDIINAMITKYKHVSPGKLSFIFDVLIIGCSYFAFHSIETIIYGYVTMAVCAYAIDVTLQGNKQSVQFFIISEKYKEISEKISSTGRGITLINGKGWYTKKDKYIIMVIVRRYQVPYILSSVRKIDPKSFVSSANVNGVYGEGFEKIK